MDRDASGVGTGLDRADVADLLAPARLICAPIMLWLVSIRSLDAAVLVVVIAWWTDFLDGRLARKAHRETRLRNGTYALMPVWPARWVSAWNWRATSRGGWSRR